MLATLDYQEPDHVPVDVGGGYSASMSVERYENLKQYLGITRESEALDSIFRIAKLSI